MNTVSQSSDIVITTSVRGQQDYRFGTDSALVNSDGEQTQFGCNVVNTGTTQPSITDSLGTAVVDWFRGDTVNPFNGFQAILQSNTGFQFFQSSLGGTTQQSNSFLLGNQQMYLQGIEYYTSTAFSGSTSIADIWLLVNIIDTTITANLINLNQGVNPTITLSYDSVHGLVLDGTILTGIILTTNKFYLLDFFHNGTATGVNVWDITKPMATKPYTVIGNGNSPNTVSDVTINNPSGSGGLLIADIILYENLLSTTQQQTVLDYFQDRYQRLFNLPLTFPAGSTSQPNI